jgi:hypothetical protein
VARPSRAEPTIFTRPGSGARSRYASGRRGILPRRLTVLRCFLLLPILFGFSPLGSANDIYIAQNRSGSDTGADCANAHAATFFNTAGNWGSGATQIGAGTTVHLCGTLTFGANTSGLRVQGSGASGNPVTILFEANAILQSPAFNGTFGSPGGGIVINGFNFITVDGGANGIIQNTANGTGLANSQSSTGVYMQGVNTVTVKNLTIQHIYDNLGSVSSASDINGFGTYDILLDQGTNSASVTITNNTLSNAKDGVDASFENTNIAGLTISNNTTRDHCFQLEVVGITGSATNVLIYGNDMSDWTNWQWPTSVYHQDGLITYTGPTSAGAPTYAPFIYNNYIHGNLGNGSPTGYIYCTSSNGGSNTDPTPIQCTVFNNLIVNAAANDTCIWLGGATGPHVVYNNTIVGPGTGGGYGMVLGSQGHTTNVTLKNNIFVNLGVLITDYDHLNTDVLASDFNVFFNFACTNNCFNDHFGSDGVPSRSYATWKALSFETHSSTSDPKLDPTDHLQSGSSAIGLGLNLTSSGMTALNSDKAGTARPSSSAWDDGAYTYSGNRPASPTGLKVTVQ